MTPLVSVVMATYNGEQFIKEAIASVLEQTLKDFEFIIVDDGSTDTTAQIINTFEDNRIQYLKKEKNSGIADSLNLGISRAKGNYIARMDDDDVCMPNRFKEQLKILEKNSGIILCGTGVNLIDGKTKMNPEHSKDIKMQMLFSNAITHPTVMIRKEALIGYKYKPNKVPSEDYDLWSRLIWKGEFYNIQTPLLFYRYLKTSETSTRRQDQLQLNVSISKFMFEKAGFIDLPNSNENIRIFASRDYSISGKQLRGLIKWFEDLKTFKANNNKFPSEKFNILVNVNLEQFLISFFTNQRIINKIKPFFNLNFYNKKLILNYYFNKLHH